jgi:hypothetical protein
MRGRRTSLKMPLIAPLYRSARVYGLALTAFHVA